MLLEFPEFPQNSLCWASGWVGELAYIHPSLPPSLPCLSRVESALGIGIVKWGSKCERNVIHSLLQHPAAQKNINPKQMCH